MTEDPDQTGQQKWKESPTRLSGFLLFWELSRGVHLMFLSAAKADLSCARGSLLLQSSGCLVDTAMEFKDSRATGGATPWNYYGEGASQDETRSNF